MVTKTTATATAPKTLDVSGLEYCPEKMLTFQMGVPAYDAFPATTWARLLRQSAQETSMTLGYANPKGLEELRTAIAAHVAITRGIKCSPDQVIVTTGYRNGLAIALRALRTEGRQAWMEDPGYPVTRFALEASSVEPIPVPVDEEGINVARGRALAPDPALVVITPGLQAPTGVPLSNRRQSELLLWAEETDTWIIEDDYLAELHPSTRPTTALAAGAGAKRVIHLGTFSKKIAPAVGLGFLIAPTPLVHKITDVVTWLVAPPNLTTQHALTTFLREGHYLRHLRKMRRLYSQRRQSLVAMLERLHVKSAKPAGLAILLSLPNDVDDQLLVRKARELELGPSPLSVCYAEASRAQKGLILGITNVLERRIEQDCANLLGLIEHN